MGKLIECKDKTFWDDNLVDLGGHPFQLWGWGEVKAFHGWKADRLYEVDEQGSVVAMAEVLTRSFPWPLNGFSYIPRGPISSDGHDVVKFLNDVAKYIKNKYHSVVLSIEPHWFEIGNLAGQGWSRTSNTIIADHTILLDLNKSEDQLLKDMARKNRQSIHKAERNIESIRPVTTDNEFDQCMEIYRQTGQRSNFALHSVDYYKTVRREMGSNSMIYAAYVDGKMAGFLWLAISGEVAYQMYSGINSLGAHNRVNSALRWFAIRKTKEWGIKEYDFGGMIEGGVAEFKRVWSDHVTEFIGTYNKPLSQWYWIWSVALPLGRKWSQRVKRIVRKIKN